MRIKAAVACGAAALAGAALLYRTPAPDAAPTRAQRTEQAVERSFMLLAETGPQFGDLPAQPARRPSFALGADGKLAIDERTSILLDVALASLPRHPLRTQLESIGKELVAGLPPDAARELAQLLRNYVAYRELEAQLGERQRADPALTPAQALEQLHALRVAHLGERLAASMYGKEEKQMRADAAATHAAATQAAATQAAATQAAATQAAATQAAATQAAAAADSGVAADPVLDRLRDDVAALRSAGAAASKVAALREQVLGADRAQQLQETEQVQADWEQRSAAFLAAAQPGADTETLLRGLYSEQELPAARAYNLERLRSRQAGTAR